MKFTYYGQSAFSLEIDGQHLVFDPFITPNLMAKDIDIQSIKADYVLLSHGHYDHIVDALDIAKNNDATIVSNFEIISWYGTNGYKKGHPMNHGGQWQFDFGKVKFTNAVHSSVLPDGTYGGNSGGFLIMNKNINVYYAGDTALTVDMQLIPLWAKLDVVILPIGDNFTMGVDDAILAADFVKCDNVIGVHYDTFPYIEIDKKEAVEKFAAAGKKLLLPKIGESIQF